MHSLATEHVLLIPASNRQPPTPHTSIGKSEKRTWAFLCHTDKAELYPLFISPNMFSIILSDYLFLFSSSLTIHTSLSPDCQSPPVTSTMHTLTHTLHSTPQMTGSSQLSNCLVHQLFWLVNCATATLYSLLHCPL